MKENMDLKTPVESLVNPRNLALLHRSDRFVITAAGLVAVAALGAVAALRQFPVGATVLAMLAMVVVVGMVALVQWRALSMQGVEADLITQANAAAAVNGDWWQLVYAPDHPGLSYVSIAVSELAGQHAMHGITYDHIGRRLARWSSDAIAIRTSAPIEIYYIWRGTLLGQEDASIISGIGRYRFDSVGREKRPLQGEGAFTRGSPTEMGFGTPRALEMVRFTELESQRLAEDPYVLATLAREAFERFQLSRDRDFSEQYLTPGRQDFKGAHTQFTA
ncbi:MAG TPA: hypothetical protein VLT88_09270 [Desulfosarcina sp.]|nr:hypothetical protein [Desulfosarcina sp.]